MLKQQPSDTVSEQKDFDSENEELLQMFLQNQKTLGVLTGRVAQLDQTSLDPIVRAKLKELKNAVLVSDLKSQEHKIDLLTKTLDELCSPMNSLND